MPKKIHLALILVFATMMAVLVAIPRTLTAQFPPITPPGAGTPGFPGGTGFPGFPGGTGFPGFPGVTPTITLTPTPPLTPPPTSAAPGCVEPFPIAIGGTVTVRSGVSIRSEPSVSAPLLNVFQEPRNFTVLDGPICNENYFWWQIQGHGLIGWVAQANNTLPFITSIRAPGRPCPSPLPIVAGQVVELAFAVRVRAEPSLQGLVLTVAPYQGRVLFLQNEPICADGFNWRLVEVTVVGVVYRGWLAEGTRSIPSAAFIVQPTQDPSQVCLPPLRLQPGDLRRVRYRDGTPKNLHSAPGRDAPVLYTLVEYVPLEIIGGPICVDGLNFWQVRVLGTTPVEGWLAEGARGNYYLGPYTIPPNERCTTLTNLNCSGN